MARVREQPERENRITFDIVVDAYDEIERAMGWYCYLQDKLQMPFKARCKSARATSPLEVGNEAEVVDMADEDDCTSEIFVVVKHGKSKLSVPLAQIECVTADEDTLQAVADWHYWVARGYQY
jgi:Calcium binding